MAVVYKHDIPAWMDGTESLSDGAYRAYHVIVQLIVLNHGPITLNERGIAGRCYQTLTAFSRSLDELLAAQKIMLINGKIMYWRARSPAELTSILGGYAVQQEDSAR